MARVQSMGSFDLAAEATPYDRLVEDLGIDSLQIFELIVIVEAMAGCMVPPAQIPMLETMADAYDYYWSCVSST